MVILLILWIHALVMPGMLMFVHVCSTTHYMSVYVSEHKVAQMWTFSIEMQLQCSRPRRILHTKTHLGSCAQHPCTARLAECNHPGLQRGEEGHGQAGTRVCRSASEPWKGEGMILGEDKRVVGQYKSQMGLQEQGSIAGGWERRLGRRQESMNQEMWYSPEKEEEWGEV